MMIRQKKALDIVLSSVKPVGSEQAAINNSLNRITRSEIKAGCDLPLFSNSAMDGYAVRSEDLKGVSICSPRDLRVAEDIPAGHFPRRRVKKGEAARIMTGAPLPGGADSVVMVEFTKTSRECGSETVSVHKAVRKGDHVRLRGEDVRKGDRVMSKGTSLTPQTLGMLAALGVAKVDVAKRPRVGILATGSELVDITKRPGRGKVRNCNTIMIRNQVFECGGEAVDLGIAGDTRVKIEGKIKSAFTKRLDTLIIMGGVSVGDYDFVKDVLLKLGMKLGFWKVAQRPGKPLLFGSVKGLPVFGLPGNPVSASVIFEEYARPYILSMQGAKEIFRPVISAVLTGDFDKRKGFKYFLRARLKIKKDRFYATLTGPQGSAIINSLVLADGIVIAPERTASLKKGQEVPVQLIRHPSYGGAA